MYIQIYFNFYYSIRQMDKFGLLVMTIKVVGCLLCNDGSKRGPFEFGRDSASYTTPSKILLEVERVRIVRDVELAVMYRSYWSSYCYNGGALDGNTGCYSGLTQALPSYEESLKWIKEARCYVGKDCTDCWGSDSDACLSPNGGAEKFPVSGKELTRRETNNHFMFHTCNISWRCGIHSAKFPTFITRRNGRWLAYTEQANGTELMMDGRDYWTFADMSIRKTNPHEAVVEKANVSCFWKHNRKQLACYDEQFSNFVEFEQPWTCLGKYCYFTREKMEVAEEMKTQLANLRSASIEDLKQIIAEEHMLNEEMRYNFGLILSEYRSLRKVTQSIILSAAKVDDRLIGNILGQPARSHFVSDSKFFLSPCSDPTKSTQNCENDLIFKDGRWTKLIDPSECVNVSDVKKLELFGHVELWFPDSKDIPTVGVSENMEGWSFIAHEKANLKTAMEWVEKGQHSTSISDVYAWPKGFLDFSVKGFVVTHITTILATITIAYVVFKKLFRTGNISNPIINEIKLEDLRERSNKESITANTSQTAATVPPTLTIVANHCEPPPSTSNTMQTVITMPERRV